MSHASRLSWLQLGGVLITLLVGCGDSSAPSVPDPADSGVTPGGGDGGTQGTDGGTSTDGGTVADGGASADGGTLPPFSFFVTSLKAMQELSGSQSGFGGDLRFGETGAGAGLRGADKICATIAERSMPGAGQKPWRAFLSAVAGEDGQQVNAIDRIGSGPWYDRLGRLLASTKADLLHNRPSGGSSVIVNDFPNEDGVPNHRPDPSQASVDNHDFLTGTNSSGKLYSSTATCKDWTAAAGDKASEGRPRVGHSWPRSGGGGGGTDNWMSALDESGCAPGVNLIETGPPDSNSNTVGSGGGYGGIYCFSLIP
ncbi:hypothetical protein [Hyalangium versicolor]|uniref:hypothetical protein n=1 Tax=Hyalangium versicolor TaxID=2861190 RepID=UPI001CCFFE27|nr:hypothetical protein [Hyalangium versicolor]